MKKAMAAAAVIVAAAAAAVVPGAAHAGTTSGWNRIFQGGSTGYVSSVDPISASNIWEATGLITSGGTTIYKPDVLRYNGSTWSTVTIPGATGMETTSVQSTWKNNVWVFGDFNSKQNVTSSAAFRYNGSSWTRISVPAQTYLQGTVVLGPWNVWAFGSSGSMFGDIFHWTGSGWKAYNINFLPQAISASSASNIWIVGLTSDSTPKLVAYHWNGSHWYKSAAPQPAVGYTGVSVAALSGSNVWLGWTTATTGYAYHYNGSTWTKVTGRLNANAAGLAPDGRGGVWWGPFADLDGTTWTDTSSVSPSYSSGGFGPVASIPGTSSAVMAAGVTNVGSSVEHPTIYRLNF